MVGFEEAKADLEAVGASVFAVSVDAEDKAKEVQDEVSFPIGYGAIRDQGDAVGAFWEDRRSIIQPSEFIVYHDGTLDFSSYSDGPLSRMIGSEAAKFISIIDSRK